MDNMHLNEGDVIYLRSASILKGSYVKLQPQTSDFIQISNPKAVLERSLGAFSALTKGETFRILYNKKKYDIGVVEVRTEGGRPPDPTRPWSPDSPHPTPPGEAHTLLPLVHWYRSGPRILVP